MPTTSRGAPYPGPGDPNNPPADLYALAQWITDQLDVSGPQLPTSGVYTPALTLVTNAASATAPAPWLWSRIGDVVTVDGQIQITPSATGAVAVGASLHVASDLGVGGDLSGVISAKDSPSGLVVADSTLNRANILFTAVSTVGILFSIHFAYRVI